MLCYYKPCTDAQYRNADEHIDGCFHLPSLYFSKSHVPRDKSRGIVGRRSGVDASVDGGGVVNGW
uniref:Uncharacterized protein n=1 Tax=Candidatus Methanogaster sp. ANME-2c ERB4 TaxID=2759911 RepID=A0A7G9YGM7_9EURY|nr:hypothetical protein FLPJBPEJ_00005 [Methanosarcinales archaeon ANME-2c ERB4]